MPAIKFSQLSTLNTVQSGTIIPVVYNGTNYKLTVDLLKGYVTPVWSEVRNKPSFAEVAFSGDYSVLVNKPTIPTRVSQLEIDVDLGDTAVWSSIIGKPTFATVATSGSYADLINKPNLAVYVTATGLTSILSSYTTQTYVTSQGYITTSSLTWNNITGKPTFATVSTSGSYTHLTNTPVLATVATSGRYSDLSDKPLNLSNFNNDIGLGGSISTATVTALIANSLSNFVSNGLQSVAVTGANGRQSVASTRPDGSLFLTANSSTVGSVFLMGQQSYIISGSDISDGATYKQWTFSGDGKLTLPAGGDIVDSNGTSVLGGGTSNGWQLTSSTAVVSLASNGTTTFPNGLQVTSEPHNSAVIVTSGSTNGLSLRSGVRGDNANAYVNLAPNGVVIDFDGDNPGPWVFRADGSITFPDGSKQVTAGGLIQSATAPATTSTRVLWYDTVGGRSYVYYDAGWVDASPVSTASATTSTLVNGSHSVVNDGSGALVLNDVQYIYPSTAGKDIDIYTNSDHSSELWLHDNGPAEIITDGGAHVWSFGKDSRLTFPNNSRFDGQTLIDYSSSTNYTLKIANGGVDGSKFGIGTGDATFGIANDALNHAENGYVPYTVTAQNINLTVPGAGTWAFGADGTLTLPDGSTVSEGFITGATGSAGGVANGGTGYQQFYAQGDGAYVQTSVGNAGTVFNTWTFGLDGSLTLPNSAAISNTNLGFHQTFPTNGAGGNSSNNNSLAVGIPNPAWAAAILANPSNYYIRFASDDYINQFPISGISGPTVNTNIYTLTGTWTADGGAFPITISSYDYVPDVTAISSIAGVQINTAEGSWLFGTDGDLTLAGGNVFFSNEPDSTVMYNNGISISSGTQYGTTVQGNTAGINQYWFADGTMPTRKWAAVRVNSPEDASTGSVVVSTGPFNSRNNWIFAHDGSTVLPENTLKGYCFTATNAVENYIPQAGAFYYTDNPILRSIATIGGAWYIKGPGLVGWKQITGVQDNGTSLIIRIGGGLGPLPDGSEFHSVGYLPNSPDLVYTISQYLDLDIKAADKTWTFGENGSVTFPDSTIQTTAFTASSYISKATLQSIITTCTNFTEFKNAILGL
jgi:hypothetical protein